MTAPEQTTAPRRRKDHSGTNQASGRARRPANSSAAESHPGGGKSGASTPATPHGSAQAKAVEEMSVDLIDPADDNPRGKDVGDVAELAASIGQVGVLQPVTVTPRGERFVLVYGHRRLAATRQAGLATIPAIVRPMSEVERITRQTIENAHRRDLTVLQEATAIANLRDAVAGERDGVPPTHRELAAMLGVSQSHVSKRLELLELPERARALVDSGGITLEQAGQLHRLVVVGRAEQAARLANQQAKGELNDYSGRSTLTDFVDAGVNDARARAREAKVRAELAAVGGQILEEPEDGWWSSPAARIAKGQRHDERRCAWTTVELTRISVAEHATAHPGGHAARLCQAHGEAVWMCTDPTVHAEIEERAAERTADQNQHNAAERQRKEYERQLSHASKAREAVIAQLLAKRVSVPISVREVLTRITTLGIDRQESEAAKLTCRYLGLEPVIERGDWQDARAYKNYREAVRRHLGEDLGRVAYALWLAEGEFRARWLHSRWHGLALDYIEHLMAAGYQLSPAEQQRLQEARHAQQSQPEASPALCDCGEELGDHKDGVGACQAEGCGCPAYRPAEWTEDETPGSGGEGAVVAVG